ncbi:Lipase, GDSL [Corchorus olitorius]|uniref:Lipase, GDSL n=1 Tax=Corchorus olitorius TaxID=93759 RepID=A0A1R3IGA1_9ROSI|nr:Lipase, GDSL [Corchorus olitorius]
MAASLLIITIFGICLAISVNSSSSVVAARKPPCHFPAIFNFGDSNSDTGGLSAVFGQAPSPHGETFFHRPAGRYCDGRLVIDFIAQRLGLPYLSPFLDSIGTNFTHGANFATSGSTIRPQNTTFRQTGGVYETLMPKHEDFSKALYTFDIGQNDLAAGYFLNMSTDENIYWQGGRYFWVHNTGPVGCLPYVMDRLPILASQIDEYGCASPFNEVAQFFNRELNKAVQQLRKDLPLAAITYVDVYSLKYSLITNGRKHGFIYPFRACCGHGGKYNYNKKWGCGSRIYKEDGKEVLVGKSCKKPSAHVNWDGIHFTEAANKYIFDRIVDGSFSDPPTPLNMACYREEYKYN